MTPQPEQHKPGCKINSSCEEDMWKMREKNPRNYDWLVKWLSQTLRSAIDQVRKETVQECMKARRKEDDRIPVRIAEFAEHTIYTYEGETMVFTRTNEEYKELVKDRSEALKRLEEMR